MSDTIWVAILTLVGTLCGSFGGILTSGRLTGYRLDRLEEEVKKYNETNKSMSERISKLEEHTAVIDEQIRVCNHRISDLEKGE